MGLATIGVSSGKWYYEHTFTGSQNNAIAAGIVPVDDTSSYPGQNSNSVGYNFNGTKVIGTTQTSYGATYDDGDVIGVAFDADNGTVVFYKNGVKSRDCHFFIVKWSLHCCCFSLSSGTGSIMNFGQRPFAYSAPSNYKAFLHNEPPDPDDCRWFGLFHITAIWSGNSASSRTITTGFDPDWVWVKNRGVAGRSQTFTTRSVDLVQTKKLFLIQLTKKVQTQNSKPRLCKCNNIRWVYSSGATNSNYTNQSGQTYVGWAWDAASSTVSNTDGSITSQVRANQTAGFQSFYPNFYKYNKQSTVGHGLNAKPDMIIWKKTSGTSHWPIYHNSTWRDFRLST